MPATVIRSEFFKRFENTPQDHDREPDKGTFKKHAPAAPLSLLCERFESKALE
jgi:hypothetical protein